MHRQAEQSNTSMHTVVLGRVWVFSHQLLLHGQRLLGGSGVSLARPIAIVTRARTRFWTPSALLDASQVAVITIIVESA